MYQYEKRRWVAIVLLIIPFGLGSSRCSLPSCCAWFYLARRFTRFIGPGVICGLSLLLVLVLAPRVFLRVLRFSSLRKNQHFQIPIRSGTVLRLIHEPLARTLRVTSSHVWTLKLYLHLHLPLVSATELIPDIWEQQELHVNLDKIKLLLSSSPKPY